MQTYIDVSAAMMKFLSDPKYKMVHYIQAEIPCKQRINSNSQIYIRNGDNCVLLSSVPCVNTNPQITDFRSHLPTVTIINGHSRSTAGWWTKFVWCDYCGMQANPLQMSVSPIHCNDCISLIEELKNDPYQNDPYVFCYTRTYQT